jgi:amidase/formamidase
MNIGSAHAINHPFEVEALSVIVAQIPSLPALDYSDVDKNVDHIIEYMERASVGYPGYDLFVTPECVLQGSSPDLEKVLLTLESSQIKRICSKCEELQVWGVFTGSFEFDGKKPCNISLLVDDHGNIVHEYVKMNPFVPFEVHYPGWEMKVSDGPKGARIATIICADGDYPELWRDAACKGANVIVRSSRYMSPWENAWEITNKAGAYFNNCYVVGCNAIGIDNGFVSFGYSMIVGPDGNIICKGSLGTEWILKADLYPKIIDEMRKNSSTHNFLYAFRHRGGTHRAFSGTGDERFLYDSYNTRSEVE